MVRSADGVSAEGSGRAVGAGLVGAIDGGVCGVGSGRGVVGGGVRGGRVVATCIDELEGRDASRDDRCGQRQCAKEHATIGAWRHFERQDRGFVRGKVTWDFSSGVVAPVVPLARERPIAVASR